jgi:hypothetical protein
MDDLSGLDWSSSTKKPSSQMPTNPAGANYYSSLRPTPSPFASGRNTPLSAQGSGTTGSRPPAPKAAPQQDSFSNLMSFAGAPKSTANLSLREQQERLLAEKKRKEEERRKQAEAQYGNGAHFETLGSGNVSRTASPFIQPPPAVKSDDDLFAAFKAETKVDNASFYPPPPDKAVSLSPAPGLNLSDPSQWNNLGGSNDGAFGDDDDPFGLNTLRSKAKAPSSIQTDDEEGDDLLGDLGRPVEEVRKKQQTVQPRPEPGRPIEDSESDSEDDVPAKPKEIDAFDRAVSQLVDYGFSLENARRGLTESGAGLNVQAAANWLLDDAHRQAKEKAKGVSAGRARGREDSRPRQAGQPAWMKDDDRLDSRNRSPAAGEGDFAQTAAALSSKAFKTAGSLWKMGQKKMQQAVADFQQPEAEPNVPKWMRSAQQERMHPPEKQAPDVTDEAMLLESGMRPGHRPSRPAAEPRPGPTLATSRDHSPALSAHSSGRNTPIPKWQQSASASGLDSRSRLSKLAMEEDSSTYVSPNRRKKTTPQPQAQAQAPPPPEPEGDLLFSDAPQRPQQPLAHRQQRPIQQHPVAQPVKQPTPRASKAAPVVRPAAPQRQIPQITPVALQTSTRHRLDGTAHFKRGDYAAAHSSYSSSLAVVPPTHPLTIILLTNRALTSLKTGAPKLAVEDADAAIKIIGPSLGHGETVAVVGDSGGEEKRDMKDLYGKALSRKAEALEQMERWADASAVWQLCVEGGVGGATAIAGRQRCQSALAPKPKPTLKPASKPAVAKTRPKITAVSSLGPQKSSEAVERLREANKAAAKEDDEKFALSERVDAKIAAWRDGKRDNLRALLGSLENVMWEGSGWKKVGLHELVMANKVKIAYMKAIAKTHPDKVSTRLIPIFNS